MSKKCGGTSAEKPVDDEIVKMCEEIKKELEKQSGKKYSKYLPLKYKSQVVAGTNFFVKIYVETGDVSDHIHVRIFRPLPCNGDKVEVSSFQEGKDSSEEIVYF